MSKSKKGLADTGEGEFILNESGTSVSTDKVEPDTADNGDAAESSERDSEST